MWYALLIALLVMTALLALRLRIRLELSEARRFLFVGLGRTGPEFDFVRKTGTIRLFGLRLKSFSLQPRADSSHPSTASTPPQQVRPGTPRRISIGELFTILPQTLSAAWQFVVGLIRSVVIEECRGEIRVGLATPDQTGQMFGCYCALAGIAPSLGARLRFDPDWTGPSLSGSVRFAAALPLYALLYRLLILICALPLRQMYRIIKGKPRGERHAQ